MPVTFYNKPTRDALAQRLMALSNNLKADRTESTGGWVQVTSQDIHDLDVAMGCVIVADVARR